MLKWSKNFVLPIMCFNNLGELFLLKAVAGCRTIRHQMRMRGHYTKRATLTTFPTRILVNKSSCATIGSLTHTHTPSANHNDVLQNSLSAKEELVRKRVRSDNVSKN